MLLCELGVRLLGNVLAGKGEIAMRPGRRINKAGYGNKKGKGIVRTGLGFEASSIKLNFKHRRML